MTEEEAKTKWCPMGIGLKDFPNSPVGQDNPRRCIGSACMAWRWDEEWFQAEVRRQGNANPKRLAADIARELSACGERPGYCGLAGKP